MGKCIIGLVGWTPQNRGDPQ